MKKTIALFAFALALLATALIVGRQPHPVPEACNNYDDNCDGSIADMPPSEEIRMIFFVDNSAAMCEHMHALNQAIADYALKLAMQEVNRPRDAGTDRPAGILCLDEGCSP